ncbi:MAG: hypothetical protein A2V62_10215 [Nitrospirae bacterium RBG_19FT_COMBO_58_9]|nr:MAG: hypothetical protein A2V62_10215 [Nitrospirae bacterium RBG_19FT_COMBO_58_9]
MRARFRRDQLGRRLQKHRQQHFNFAHSTPGQQPDDAGGLVQAELPAKRCTIVLRRHGIE